ncbi:MAG TPA: tetratricopeptide repeat protein [Vicinamibacterales bacterium]|nr:tetratricopeptide repeat protein [Vicinamibacterales bacterium]
MEPATFPPSALDALIDIELLLKRVQNATKSLTPTQQAVQSWCWFAQGSAAQDSGKLNEAGRIYLALPTFPADGGPVVSGSAAATTCFALACNWSAATEAARKWIADAPKDAQAHRRLAEAHYKQNEIPEAVRTFEDYVRHRQGDDDDWESSLLMHLGLEVHARRSIAATLEAAAFSASIRPQGERLVAWFCPWFDSLSRKTKERWWVGIFSLSSPHVATEMESERWDVAADSFGEAVAFELKERVFAPFVADSPGLRPPDDHWRRALAGRGMLGEA